MIQLKELSLLALDALESGVIILDKELKILYVNEWLKEHLYGGVAIQGNTFMAAFPDMVGKRIHHTIIKCLEFGLSKKIATRLLDTPFPLFDLLEREKQLLQSISIYPIKIKDENFTYIDIHNVTNNYRRENELKSQALHLQKLANYDPLTGIMNRRYFNQRLEEFVAQSTRMKTRFAIMFLDLDRFKEVNDKYGHNIGDELLKRVSDYLKRVLRKNDIVGRFGGDEFIILIDNIVKEDQPAQVAAKLIEGFKSKWIIEGNEVGVGVSIGISVFPEDGTTGRIILQKADTAMYSAKNLGRGRFQYFSAKMGENVQEKAKLEREIRIGLEQGQFELYFQPQINLDTMKIHGCEALIRWNHPERGLVAPLHFIPFAEQSFLIVSIGKWVIEESAKFCSQLGLKGLADILMSVNLSPRQFETLSLYDVLQHAIHVHGVKPAQFILEITETHLMSSQEKSINTLKKLKSEGYHIALDDFGTGYSSLAYLKNLPLDYLKIDRVFVKDLVDDLVDQKIITSIIKLAQGLSLQVVADGAENMKQVEKLKELGCEVVQGAHYAKPMQADEFLDYCIKFQGEY